MTTKILQFSSLSVENLQTFDWKQAPFASIIHRIIEQLGLEWPISFQHCCHGQEHPPLDKDAQSPSLTLNFSRDGELFFLWNWEFQFLWNHSTVSK